jgi:cytochrome c553
MLPSEHDPHGRGDPWPLIGWSSLVIIVAVAGVLGFLVLSRYQQNGPVLGSWAAICRGLGLTFDGVPAQAAKPPLQIPSQVTWTDDTLARIRGGDAARGAAIAIQCMSCHGTLGVSDAGLMPTLAGMDAAVIYKQLDDYRNGLRSWTDMTMIATLLSPQDMADVASFWTSRPGLPADGADGVSLSGRSLHQSDPAIRLAYAGDPQRGIAPCAACHGPGKHKLGAPTLRGQQRAYIEHQLTAFASGTRQNDINEQMRTVAVQLTDEERRQMAAFYGADAAPAQVAQAQALP